MLNVDYVVSGSVRRHGKRLTVTVELAETRTARIVWAEIFNHKPDDAFLVLDEIGNRIVASIASEIETIERNRAILKPPNSLDAWEAHHRGLWHMYRFNKADNERARHFFETAVRLDPTFARAYAGLSFTHFQNAFQGWAKREPEIDRAFEAAGAEPHGRRSRSRRALGHGPRALAARPPRPVRRRAGAGDRPEPELRARPLHARVRPLAGRRSARRDLVLRSLAPPEPVRPAALRHARRARHGAGAPRPVRGSRRLGRQGRRPPQRASRTSSRSPPTAWRWPARSTRRAPMPPRFAGRFRDTASPTSCAPFDSIRRARRCSAKAPGASGWRDPRSGGVDETRSGDPLVAALGVAPGQYSTTGLPGEPVAPIIFNGAQTNAPS